MPDFVVVTAFKAKDNTVKVISELTNKTRLFGKTADKAFKTATKRASIFGGVLKGILAANALSKGMSLAQRGVRSVTEEFINFDQAVTSASAKFPEKIKPGSEEFEELAKAARGIGAETQFTATQAAEGLDFLAMAGFNAKQSMAALPGVVDLATASGMDLGRATDIASDALGAFGLMTKNSSQLTTNLARVNDVFAKTVTTANTDMEMLFETMKQAGPVAIAAGADIETFAALTGKMAASGIKGSIAGTALKNAFLRLAAPPAAAAEELAKLGIKTTDTGGNLRDIIDILEDVRIKTKDMGTAQRSASLDAIFSKRAIAGVSILLQEGGEELKRYRKELQDSGGASVEMANQMRKSLGNRLAALKSAAIEVGFKFIDAFKGQIPGAIDKAIESVRKFDVTIVVEGVKKIVSFFKKLYGVLKTLKPLIIGITAAWVAYHAIQKMIMIAEAIKFFFQMAKAVRAAAAAQGILNAVMMANPLMAIAVAIGVVVTAMILLIDNWEHVVGVFKESINVIKNIVNFYAELFNDLWKSIKSGASAAWNFISGIYKESVKVMAGYIEAIAGSFSDLWSGIKTGASNLWEGLKTIFGKITDYIKGIIINVINSYIKTIQKVIDFAAKAGKYLGFETEGFKIPTIETGTEEGIKPAVSPRVPPNIGSAKETEEKKNVDFRGKMTFVNPPPGATFESQTVGAPPIQTEFLGVNP